MSNTNQPYHPRRTFLKQVGAALVTIPVLPLIGCGTETSDTINSSSGTDSSTTPSTGGSSGSSSSSWASGGTQAMTVNFPTDSLFASGTACVVALTKNVTEGPCYFEVSTTDDISLSQTGLPMQLCLQVVNSACQPLSGLEVEVWHCNVSGYYSGDTSGSADSSRFAGSFCTGNNSQAVQSKWFRGTQVTDASGRVNFKSCFPGWYSGRTIHIHFRVRNNNQDQVISQCCFNDSLTADICTTHPDYQARGAQDTTLSGGRDTVFGSQYSDFLFNTQQNTDGSLLVWKTIQISS